MRPRQATAGAEGEYQVIMPWARWAHLGTTVYHIWSHEHHAWWGPNNVGYTLDIKEAGLYSFDRAMEIVHQANEHLSPDEFPHEVMMQAIYPHGDYDEPSRP